MGLPIDRRGFLKASGIGAVSVALTGCAAVSSRGPTIGPAEQPNILVLFTDDQRFDTVHALGNDEIITPNLDRLVAGGTAFTNTYITGSHHGAVCMPSRAMLLTGRHYFNLPKSVTQSWAVPAGQRGDCPFVTFPEQFRQAGYDTFGTGKWHNGRSLFARCFTTGDAIFFGGMCNH
ncbi:MAG: sulfatase-like hydrolase/transferase, partial [Phycisphaerales bacterium]